MITRWRRLMAKWSRWAQDRFLDWLFVPWIPKDGEEMERLSLRSVLGILRNFVAGARTRVVLLQDRVSQLEEQMVKVRQKLKEPDDDF